MRRDKLLLQEALEVFKWCKLKPNRQGIGSCYEAALGSEVFDCRDLPLELLIDTGEAVFDEPAAARVPFRLPYPLCWFEFAGGVGVLAAAVDEGMITQRGITMEQFKEFGGELNTINVFHTRNGDPHQKLLRMGIFKDGSDDFFEANHGDPNQDAEAKNGAIMLVGAITLLNEKFLACSSNQELSQPINWIRRKEGLPTKSAVRVLTINVAAVRNATRSTSLAKHESPCLHWRRGHSRILHRGSEFETSTWVKRCLVGDPDKGFAGKSYRIVRDMPMILAAPTIEGPGTLQ